MSNRGTTNVFRGVTAAQVCARLVELAPFLMTGGPNAISRHPMYVGELALWLGWAILYGSIPC